MRESVGDDKMIKQNKINLGRLYFGYLFAVLFLQIVGLNAKGTLFDTLWKAIVIITTMFIVVRRTNFLMPKYLVGAILIYIFGQILAVAYYPEVMKRVSMITVLTNVAIVLAMVYMFLSMPYVTKVFEPAHMSSFLNGFILLMLYAVIFNFIQSPSAVLGVFSNRNVYENMMSSFFDNKQTFGMFLFMAVMSSLLQYVREYKRRYLLLAMVFFLNLFICMSRTALFACVFFAVLLCIFLAGKKTGVPKIISLTVFVITFVIWVVPSLRQFITDVVLDTDRTVDARQEIWDYAFSLMKGPQLLWGYLEGNATTVLTFGGRSNYAHNGVVQVLLTGGVLKLVLFCFVVARCIKTYFRIKKHDAVLAGVFGAIFGGVMMYSMGESVVLFDTSAWCVVATILCVALPCAMDAYYGRTLADRSVEGNGR